MLVQYDHVDPFTYTRSTHYGNYMVPFVAADGRSRPSPWTVSDMEADLAAHGALNSPLRMRVAEVGVGEFVVTIVAEEDVVDARFLAAAVLAEEVPASSGTSFLPYHAKTFLTPWLGEALTMSAGDSVSMARSFTVEPEWDYAQMGVAAWVQAEGGINTSDSPDLEMMHGALQAAFAPASATGVPEAPRPAFRLTAPRPDPADGSVRFSVEVAAPCRIALRIHDVAGRLVATPLEGEFGPGSVDLTWNGRSDAGSRCASGVYFARLAGTARDGREACPSLAKVVLVR